MPRGRARKPRLSRMDAAVDAMSQYGFSQQRVRKHVKELLKEYGGDEGWPFIEDCSYKELIEAILREPEMDVLAVDNGDQVMDNSCGSEEPTHHLPPIAHDEANEESRKDIIPDQTCIKETDNLASENDKDPSTISGTLALPSPDNIRPTKTPPKHCYGWIESDEEDANDFMHLQPAPGAFGPKANLPGELSKCVGDVGTRRKSRWDERPDDG